MRSLLIITAAFAFLAAYLEAMSNHDLAAQTVPVSYKVIRTQTQPIANVTTSNAVKSPSNQATTLQLDKVKPLNLSIPNQTSYLQHISEQRRAAINWFKPRNSEAEITYNAELVFDSEKGEEITGGKVNIRIPLT